MGIIWTIIINFYRRRYRKIYYAGQQRALGFHIDDDPRDSRCGRRELSRASAWMVRAGRRGGAHRRHRRRHYPSFCLGGDRQAALAG